MKKIKNLLEPLNLIYYEYDEKTNVLILDKNWSHDYIFSELIKITYTFSKNHITFFIDENKFVVIADSDTLLNKIKRYFKSIVSNARNRRMNIFILSDKKVKWAKNLPVIEIRSIKITHTFSKNHITFFIDENKSVVIAASDTPLDKIKRYFKLIVSNTRNSRMNIYILSDKKVKWAKNLPVIEIQSIKQNVDFSNYDALVFTSKNAIYSIDAMDKTWKKKPSYVIAPQTAKVVKELGGELKFVGKEKYGDKFALEIVKKFKHQKVLYIRGSKIVSDIVNILNTNDVMCDELIIYETVCKKFDKEIKLPKNSTIIFSSPSTIKCFLKNISWDKSFKAISIGDTTAKYFPKDITPIIADTTSLASCVKKAIELNN